MKEDIQQKVRRVRRGASVGWSLKQIGKGDSFKRERIGNPKKERGWRGEQMRRQTQEGKDDGRRQTVRKKETS